MKLDGMIVFDHEPGDPLPETDTDWAAIDALTDEELTAAALADPDAQPIPLGTDEELAKLGLHRQVNVKRLRESLALTQEEFAGNLSHPGRHAARLGTVPQEPGCAGTGLSAGDRPQPPGGSGVAQARSLRPGAVSDKL